MPLSATSMRDRIIAAFSAIYPGGLSPDQKSDMEPLMEAISQGIIEEFVANADVSVTVPVEPADVALQTSTTVGTPTAGPAVPTSLDGTGGIS